MADSHDMEIPQGSSLSTPLHLSGFLSGDTIQVQGDTGNLEFSVQFNIRNKQSFDDHFHFPNTNVSETQASPNYNASSYMTPITNHEDEGTNMDVHASLHANDDGIFETEELYACNKYAIVTRLRSGVLTPVKSYSPQSYGAIQVKHSSGTKQKRKERSMVKKDVLEAVLRRRSFPRKPCNSYTFFVISTWGMVRCSSFRGKSKKLSQMWCQLPQNEKKLFEDMALRDSARYKRQLVLLKKSRR